MLSPWRLVQPSYWHPVSNIEQSLLNYEPFNRLFAPSWFPLLESHRLLDPFDQLSKAEDDFFKDLPVMLTEQTKAMGKAKEKFKEKGHKTSPMATRRSKEAEVMGRSVNEQEPEHEHLENEAHIGTSISPSGNQAFSSYSYSCASILNDKGQCVETIRRRFEDSTGKIKAQHLRKIGDRSCISTWYRPSSNEKGNVQNMVSNGTVEEFERLWDQTAFAELVRSKSLETNESSSGGSASNACSECTGSGGVKGHMHNIKEKIQQNIPGQAERLYG